MQISIAIEEIFINICNYAYPDEQGTIELQIEIDPPTHRASFTFIDSGIPYDPLEKEDPDVTLSAEERPIGGPGVFMVKQLMDTVNYRREDGKNILFLQKRLI